MGTRGSDSCSNSTIFFLQLQKLAVEYFAQVMGRRHVCCHKQKLKKGLWSPEEDEKLMRYITKNGHGRWSSVPKHAGLERCGKSCRLRWINYLRPDLKRGTFSSDEEKVIIELHEALGNRWSQIATRLPGRTDNEIKNFWNSCIKKKLKERGIDPNTHKPIMEVAGPSEDKSGDHHQNSLRAEDSGFSLAPTVNKGFHDDKICLKPSAINSNAIVHKEIPVPNSFPQPAPTSQGFSSTSLTQLSDPNRGGSYSNPLLRLLPGSLPVGIYGSMDIFKPQEEAQSAIAPNLKPASSEYTAYSTVSSCSQSGSLVAFSNQGIPRNTTCFSSLLCDHRVLQIEEELSVSDNHGRFWDTDDKNPCTMDCKNYAIDGSFKWSDLLMQQSYDSTGKDKVNQGIPWQLQESSHLIYEKTSPALQPSNMSPDFQHIAAVLDQIQ